MLTQPPLTLPTVSTKNEAQANQNDTSGSKLSVADSLVLLQSLKQSSSSVYMVNQGISALLYSFEGKGGSSEFCPTASFSIIDWELVLAAASKDPELHHILQLASQGRANVTQLRALGTAIKAIEAGTYSGPTNTSSAPQASPVPVATVSRAGQAQAPAQPQPVPTTQPRPAAATATSIPSTAVPASIPTVVPIPTAPPAPKPPGVSAPTLAPAAAPASTSSTHVPTPTSSRTMAPPALPTTAVLLEFAERPIDRWLLPTEYVLIDRRSNGDIHLSTFYPFDAYVPAGGAMRSKPAHPITMRFVEASNEIWNALSRTCTTVSPANVQAILAEVIANVPQRTYIQYRIAPGALWEDIKTANPHAQSFLLPSKTPIPSTTTARQRRTDSTTGGSAPKKRKTDPGDSTTSKAKTKGKEKEAEPTPSAAPTSAQTNQPAVPLTPRPIVPSNVPAAPAGQIPTPVIPKVAEPTPKIVTAATPTPNTPAPKPTPTTSNVITSRPSLGQGVYSARDVRTSNPGDPTRSNNPAGPLSHPQHPALSPTSPPSQPQTFPPSQQAGQPLKQNTSVDSPATEGKSQ
ncbi:hypothetical protein FRC11_006835 [Ceratobasidium sp. 423]|nr:hypothetical protein FRC11_006835 [Ceratobasidium sp. 423]